MLKSAEEKLAGSSESDSPAKDDAMALILQQAGKSAADDDEKITASIINHTRR